MSYICPVYKNVNMVYSVEDRRKIVDDICKQVIEEKTSFNKAIANSPITPITFYDWILRDEEVRQAYNYAREVRADTLFEEIIDIADEPEEGEVITEKPTGIEIKRGDMTDHRRLKIDARKWVVARMLPKKYGDKVDLTSGGEKLQPTTIVFRKYTDE